MNIIPASPYQLENRYQLLSEMRFFSTTPIATGRILRFVELGQHTLEVSPPALLAAIVLRIPQIIELATQLSHTDLNAPYGTRHFTPLHVAVITGNETAAKQLLEAKASPTSRDYRHWTPLHHAALSGNQRMMQLLSRDGAENALTNHKATAADIFKLTHPESPNEDEELATIWEENNQKFFPTQRQFLELTGAKFTEENRFSPLDYWDMQWNACSLDMGEAYCFTGEYIQKYLEYTRAPLSHVLKKVTVNSEGRPVHGCGNGYFARREVKPGEIIGEFCGEVSRRPVESYYLAGRINCLHYRSECAFINDGFNNVVFIEIPRMRGLAKRYIFVAVERIEKGAQFCCNSGDNRSKFLPYVELRAKEVRAFVQSEGIDKLLKYYEDMWTNPKLSFNDFVRCQKTEYIFDSNAVKYALVYEGIWKDLDVQKILASKFLKKKMSVLGFRDLSESMKLAQESKLMKERLTLFPAMQLIYDRFMKQIIEKDGMLMIPKIIPEINGDLTYILNNSMDKTQIYDQMLNDWELKILPRYQIYSEEIKRIIEEN